MWGFYGLWAVRMIYRSVFNKQTHIIMKIVRDKDSAENE